MQATDTGSEASAVHGVGILLAGGLGTRIRDRHPSLPKTMIPCRGRPFLDWVLRYLAQQGVRRFVLSLGHLADVVEEHLRARPADGLNITAVREPCPLGTGGGLRLAWQSVPNSDVIVANGDSLLLADLAPAYALLAQPGVDAVVVGVHQEDASRYGTLQCSPDGRLLAFREKQPGSGLVNAGVYLLRSKLRAHLPEDRPLSIETSVFPRWLADGRDIRVHPCLAPFLDIGTPESLDAAEAFLADHALDRP